MLRPLLGIFLAVLLFAASIAPAAVTAVALRSDGDALWLLKTDTVADNTTLTTVRRRVDATSGTWVDATRLAGGFVDAAVLDGRLAVLRDDGTWRLVWDGHSIDGPVPDGRVLRIAGDRRTLWAVVKSERKDDAGRLCSWGEADGWRTAGGLPPGVDAANAALGVTAGRVWLAWADAGVARAARWDGGRWTAAVSFGAAAVAGPSVEFVSGSPRPLLLVRQDDGRTALWRPDALSTPVRDAVDVRRPAGFAMVGPMLRIVFRQDDRLHQATIDDYGRGQWSGPTRLAEPGAVAPRPGEWLNLVLLGLLTVAMLRSMRSPETLPTLPAGLRVAPLGRRAAAAIIDAVPLIASAVWAFSRFDGSAEHLREQSERVFLPVFAGGLLYLIHVTASEARFGRSLGKWLFGLRVVTLDGQRPRVEGIFVRNLMRALDAFVLPALLPLLSPGARRVGDMIAGTVVVADVRSSGTPKAG